MVLNRDYTVSYSNNVNVGTATATITGKGNYAGTVNKTFTILPKDTSTATVTLSQTSYTYDGTAKAPTVIVKDGNTTLMLNRDYTVSYKDNINVGIATVTITAKGSYTGTISKTFTITEKNISNATITLLPTTYTYDGLEKKPTATVRDGNTTLMLNRDYTISYSNNTNMGTATVTITGKGNYTGTINQTFTITAKNISNATVTLMPTTYAYDGTAKQPAVTVKDGNRTLVVNKDYTISYSNNINIGAAIVIITGKGNYTGTINKTFEITGKNISNATVTLSPTSYVYDGTEKRPTVAVKDRNTALVLNKDYTISYSNNVNIGTAKVTITGKENYTGTIDKQFEITAKNISNATVTLLPTSCTYDGTAKEPTVTVKIGNTTLELDKDYTVSYSDNVNVGTAKVTITGKGNYAGVMNGTFEITTKNIGNATVTLLPTSCTYDGTAKEPTVTVKIGNTTLVLNKDYTVSYSDNVNVGTAKATITGKGNYTGSINKTFEITTKSINNTTVTLSPTTYTYDGTAKEPTVTVKDGNTTLELDKDYTVSYSNNVNVGTATVTIIGKGRYAGTVNKTFEITAEDISNVTVTLSPTTYEYDGLAKEPTVTVKIGNTTLELNKDYTVSYSDNVNIGTAKVTITGKGNYTGSINQTFTIALVLKDIRNATVTLSPTTYEYDGTGKEPAITIKDGNTTLELDKDYTVSYSDNVNIGTAKVTITGKGNYKGEMNRTFEITAKSINNVTVTLSPTTYEYDRTAKEPTVTVKDGNTTLELDKDYTVSYSDNINAGTAKVKITFMGEYAGVKNANFEIEKGNYPYTVPSGLIANYNSTLRDVSLPKGFTWEDNLDTKVGEVGYNTFKCIYTPEDSKNYKTITGIDVVIEVKDKLKVSIKEYKTEVNEDKTATYIKQIEVGETLSDVEKRIETNGEIKFYEKNGAKITDKSQISKTGTRVKITKGTESVEYILVVKGDNNGDGKVTISDVVRAKLYLTNIKSLDGEFAKSLDINNDGKVTITDIVRINLKSVHII